MPAAYSHSFENNLYAHSGICKGIEYVGASRFWVETRTLNGKVIGLDRRTERASDCAFFLIFYLDISSYINDIYKFIIIYAGLARFL